MNRVIETILVPRGAEYQAVCQGLKKIKGSKPEVLPIPIGSEALRKYLKTRDFSGSVLVMGLCGSLSPQYKIGDVVIYNNCLYASKTREILSQPTDSSLSRLIYEQMGEKGFLVSGLTSDRLIASAYEKQELARLYNAEVIDMEGFAALEYFRQKKIATGIVRVISDESEYNIADVSSAIATDGKLQALPLTLTMMRQPLSAMRLIKGSLKALRVLTKITEALIKPK